MAPEDQSALGNIILRRMLPEDFEALRPYLQRIELEFGMSLVEPGVPIEKIYFPEGGVASVVAELPDTNQVEVGIFGRDGVSGIAGILGAGHTPHRTFIQVDHSEGYCIPLERLADEMSRRPAMRALFLKYAYTMMVQLAHTAISNAHHQMEIRLARWLLMCCDRIQQDGIALTHEFMSLMLGAQRSSVTVTLHILEGLGAIRSQRGRVLIVDRDKLKALAGDSYGQAEAEYRRLLGPID